jgi:WD40 repeat protein
MRFGKGHLWAGKPNNSSASLKSAKEDPASSDGTVSVTPYPLNSEASLRPVSLVHSKAVRALLPLALTPIEEPIVLTGSGDLITVFDVSDPTSPEIIRVLDAHWHDVTALELWVRRSRGDDGKIRQEPWVVSASLDGTIRKWRLAGLLHVLTTITARANNDADLLNPGKVAALEPRPPTPDNTGDEAFKISEDEERELAELMDDD